MSSGGATTLTTTYLGLNGGGSGISVALELVADVLGGGLLRVGLENQHGSAQSVSAMQRDTYLDSSTGLGGEGLTSVVGHGEERWWLGGLKVGDWWDEEERVVMPSTAHSPSFIYCSPPASRCRPSLGGATTSLWTTWLGEAHPCPLAIESASSFRRRAHSDDDAAESRATDLHRRDVLTARWPVQTLWRSTQRPAISDAAIRRSHVSSNC